MSNLPANILLDIFDFYRNDRDDLFHAAVWEWHILVHVCRRWRQIIFDSPLRLDLQIPYTFGTHVTKCGLDIWPNLPIAINYCPWAISRQVIDEEIISPLGHPDRVGHLRLSVKEDIQLRKLVEVLQKPFPVLRRLIISSTGRNPPLLPAEFLGGSAPRLQTIYFLGIAFPSLPTLLQSSSELVELKLTGIPPSGYISPEVMVDCLAKLPRLKTVFIRFKSTTPSPDGLPLPSIARTALPALTHFQFEGSCKYLEDFTARIICPRLDLVSIAYLGQRDRIQVVQLSTFFDLSLGSDIFRHAKARFDIGTVTFNLYRPTDDTSRPAPTVILCRVIGWQAFRVVHHMVGTFSVILSSVVHVSLAATPSYLSYNTDDLEWLHFLRQFSTVQALYISQQLAAHIATALKSITGEMVADALSSLELICLEDQPTSSIEKFIAVRKLSGHPVTAVSTEAEFDGILKYSSPIAGIKRITGAYSIASNARAITFTTVHADKDVAS